MQRNSFPGCCGITILSDFGGTHITAGIKDDIPLPELKSFLKITEEIKSDGNPYMGRQAALMATLNGEQMKRYGETFIKCGWKVLAKYRHPSHNTIISVLGRELANVSKT